MLGEFIIISLSSRLVKGARFILRRIFSVSKKEKEGLADDNFVQIPEQILVSGPVSSVLTAQEE